MRVGGQLHAPAALPPGKRPGTYCIGGWVGPRAGLDGCGKFVPTMIRSPDRPARRESLYRLRYSFTPVVPKVGGGITEVGAVRYERWKGALLLSQGGASRQVVHLFL
jgi:hypothetical protein